MSPSDGDVGWGEKPVGAVVGLGRLWGSSWELWGSGPRNGVGWRVLGGLCGDGGDAERQAVNQRKRARSGAGTFRPELQHLPLMKHFITAVLRGGGHPIRHDKFPAPALRSLAEAVILLHLE